MAGGYRVSVTVDGPDADSLHGEAGLAVLESVSRPTTLGPETLRMWTRAHGGSVVSEADLSSLGAELRRTVQAPDANRAVASDAIGVVDHPVRAAALRRMVASPASRAGLSHGRRRIIEKPGISILHLARVRQRMYTREQAKSITDKIIDMAKGTDAVEVNLTGGERSGTRWANSTITTNLVQYDRQVSVTVRKGQKVGTSDTRDFSDAGLKTMVDEAIAEADKATDSPNLRPLLGAAGIHPRGRGAAQHGRDGPAGAREAREGEPRHREGARRRRRGIHPEERQHHRQREFGGTVRLLPRRGPGLRAHLPHG